MKASSYLRPRLSAFAEDGEGLFGSGERSLDAQQMLIQPLWDYIPYPKVPQS